MNLTDRVHKFSHWVCWQVSRKLFKRIFHFEIKGDEILAGLNGPGLIAFNHSSWLDAFFVYAAIPAKVAIAPVRFLAWHIYYWLTLPVMLLSGCFPVKRGIPLDINLKKAVAVLQRGGTIALAPEGKRRHIGRPRHGRRGISYLALKTNTPILPIYIDGAVGLKLADIFKKRQITVYIGKPFFLPKYESNQPLQENFDLLVNCSELVMNKINEIKNAE